MLRAVFVTQPLISEYLNHTHLSGRRPSSMAPLKQEINEPVETTSEARTSALREDRGHEISAIQMNVSGKAKGLKTCSKFLIRRFIESSHPDKLPYPTFVALHDNALGTDCANIREAFNARDRRNAGLEIFTSPASEGVRLLYNADVVNCLVEADEDVLVQDDFFKNKAGDKNEQLFKRIAGGLFQHKASTQYIVAISYHGIHASTTKLEKEEYLKGVRFSFLHISFT